MKTSLKLIIVTLLTTTFMSCDLSFDSILFQETTMGYVQSDYTFVSDAGTTYDFNLSEGRIENYVPGNRLLITCYANSKQSDNRYSGTIISLVKPLFKETLVKSEVKDWEILGKDDIFVDNIWYSGGCLNIIAKIHYNATTATVHTMDLVWDDTASNACLVFELKHNANGDISEDDSASVCMSFPIIGLIPESVKEIPVQIKYRWGGEDGTKDIRITQ